MKKRQNDKTTKRLKLNLQNIKSSKHLIKMFEVLHGMQYIKSVPRHIGLFKDQDNRFWLIKADLEKSTDKTLQIVCSRKYICITDKEPANTNKPDTPVKIIDITKNIKQGKKELYSKLSALPKTSVKSFRRKPVKTISGYNGLIVGHVNCQLSKRDRKTQRLAESTQVWLIERVQITSDRDFSVKQSKVNKNQKPRNTAIDIDVNVFKQFNQL